MPGDPFYIEGPPNSPLLHRAALSAARPALEWILNLSTYRTLYRQIQREPDETPFEVRTLDALGIQPLCSNADMASIPSRGPLIVPANHPHGIVDGLLLASIVRRARPDVRILANHLLSRIPELRKLCFFVDPFGGPTAAAHSQAGLRAAHLWVRNGGALIVFPSGEVAHQSQPDGSHADSPWPATIGRIALSTGAHIVPAFIAGGNTKWFYAAGRVHPYVAHGVARSRSTEYAWPAPDRPAGRANHACEIERVSRATQTRPHKSFEQPWSS